MLKTGDKRAQGLSTNTIILIVLGVLILVILIIGFRTGWKNLVPWLNPTNVDEVKQACNTACSLDNVYDYCMAKRTLNDDEGNSIKTTCYVLANANSLKKYSIDKCSINCKNYGDSGNELPSCADVGGVARGCSEEEGFDISNAVSDNACCLLKK